MVTADVRAGIADDIAGGKYDGYYHRFAGWVERGLGYEFSAMMDRDDLLSEAKVLALEAIDKYIPEKATFSTFLYHHLWIKARSLVVKSRAQHRQSTATMTFRSEFHASTFKPTNADESPGNEVLAEPPSPVDTPHETKEFWKTLPKDLHRVLIEASQYGDSIRRWPPSPKTLTHIATQLGMTSADLLTALWKIRLHATEHLDPEKLCAR